MLLAHENNVKSMEPLLEMQAKDNAEQMVRTDILQIYKNAQQKQMSESHKVTKPYLVGSFGSAWGCMKYDGPGTFRTSGNYAAFGGRSFLGLGTILTGAKTYEELMSLAEKGNNLNMDMTSKDALEKVLYRKKSNLFY